MLTHTYYTHKQVGEIDPEDLAIVGTSIRNRQCIKLDDAWIEHLTGSYFTRKESSYIVNEGTMKKQYNWKVIIVEKVNPEGTVWYRECKLKLISETVNYNDSLRKTVITKFKVDKLNVSSKLVRSYLIMPILDRYGDYDTSKIKIRGRVLGDDWSISHQDNTYVLESSNN